MRYPRLGRATFTLGIALIGGCGTYVPDIQEFPGNATDGVMLIRAIAESVRCDIQNAITYVIDEDKSLPNRNARWFEDWGVQYSLTFTIEEKTSANPNILWGPPSPTNSIFTLGAGANISANATRSSKINFYYTVRELYEAADCNDVTELKYRSQSFLIQDDLKLKNWLLSYILVSGTGAGKTPATLGTALKTEALTDRIKFQVVTGGSITPAWRLTRLDVNRSGSLLSASRDRTHELLITYGPSDPKTGRLVGPASDAFVAAEIGAAVNRQGF